MRTRRRLVFSSLVVLLLLAFACDNGTEVAVPADLEKVAGDLQTDTVAATLPSMLTVRVLDDAGNAYAGASVSWSTDDGSVSPSGATTGNDGRASTGWTLDTTAGEQSATATVDGVGSVSFGATATPGQPAVVELDQDTVRFAALRDTAQFSADAADGFGNAITDSVVAWSSSDTTVAGASPNGRVWSRARGTTHIVAAAGEAADTMVMIVDPIAAELTIAPGEDTTTAGGSVQFSAEARDPEGNVIPEPEIMWSSSDVTVAAVDTTGLATTSRAGTALITATSGSAGDTATLVVMPGGVAAVVLSADSVALTAIDDTTRLTAHAEDVEGNPIGADFTWTSTDAAVATVSAAGLVRAQAEGTALVVVRADTTNAADTATIVVDQVAVTTELGPSAVALTAAGDTLSLWADAEDANGYRIDEPDASWSSLDPSVATVDSAGLLTAQAEGAATITAEVDGVADSLAIDVFTTRGVNRTWTGGQSPEPTWWEQPRNWIPAGRPNGRDTAAIPSVTASSFFPELTANAEIRRLQVHADVALDLAGHTLIAHGDVIATGAVSGGLLVMDGTGTLVGAVPPIVVTGVVTLTGETTTGGVTRVDGGVIHFDGNPLRIRP